MKWEGRWDLEFNSFISIKGTLENSVDSDQMQQNAATDQDLLFVFVLRFYGPVNPMVMLSVFCLHNHTFTGQAALLETVERRE